MNAFAEGLVSIALAVIGLGVVATLVSKNAQTGTVLTSAGTALSGSITAAEGPVLNSSGLGSLPSLTSGFGS